jgi:two-component system LytT family sensor kinase
LNNLQSFIVQNEKEMSVDLLDRLANFMRSSLYDCEKDLISMRQEMELLANYIAIEKIRFDDQANIIVNLTDNDPDYKVPPFTFLPFVENSFKHGGSVPTENILITIDLLNDTQKLLLKTKNRYNTELIRGGIGLQNIRKRLEFYFPKGYLLDIQEKEEFYSVTLEIYKS